MIDEDSWNNMIIPNCGDIEFDWFGIDQRGYLGVFSTFNSGYIPDTIKKSRTRYLEIFTEIKNLPFRFKPKLVTKEEGEFDDWLEYSKQGLISFDYLDIHRTFKRGIFDLISKPEKLITIYELGIKEDLIKKIPKFNLNFDKDEGINEEELKNKMILDFLS